MIDKHQSVLTTEELAQLFGVKPINLQVNFHRHKSTFLEERDYFLLTGDELHEFLQDHPEKIPHYVHKVGRTRRLTVWTQAGALTHTRFLTEVRAWQNYDKIYRRFQTVVIESTIIEA